MAQLHHLEVTNELMLSVFVILFERNEEMDISDILVTYEEKTGKTCTVDELERVVSRAVNVGYLKAVPQPFEFLHGTLMDRTFLPTQLAWQALKRHGVREIRS